MKVEELRTEGRGCRRCFSRLGTAVVGRANAGRPAAAVRKMRGRSGLHVPRAQGARGGQGLACVEGHRGRVCFPCGGGSRLGCAALGKVFSRRCFWPRGMFSARWFTRLGCAALGKVFCRRCFSAAGCVFSGGGLQGWDAGFRGQVGAGGTEMAHRFRRNSKNSRESRRRDRFAGRFRLVNGGCCRG